jgi:hypothetical protein
MKKLLVASVARFLFPPRTGTAGAIEILLEDFEDSSDFTIVR